MELYSINKVNSVQVSSCSNTASIRDDPHSTSRKNSSELIELSRMNKVSLVSVSSCSNTGSIRDVLTGPLGRTVWIEVIELSSTNKVYFRIQIS